MHVTLCILPYVLAVLACSQATVDMKNPSTWENSGMMHTEGYCTFTLTKRQRAGAWKMTINSNIPTEDLVVWIMKETEKLDDGKTYKLENRYEYWPQTINVQFRLVYRKRSTPITATCSSNVEETETKTTQASSLAQGSLQTDIVLGNYWKQNDLMVVPGKCVFNLDKNLEDFYITIELDEETLGIKNWISDEYDKDPKGRWYIMKNRWTANTPKLEFSFQIMYDLDDPPTGTCTIGTASEPPSTTAPHDTTTTQEPKTIPPSTTPGPKPLPTTPTADTTSSVITIKDSYQDGDKMKLKATCSIPLDTQLNSFYILIILTEDTSDLENWIGDPELSDSDGRWYLIKNFYDANPPELYFEFFVRYNVGAAPSGKCKLYTGDLKPVILKPTTPPPPTQRSTKQATHSPSTSETTTTSAATQLTTTKPSTTPSQPTQSQTSRITTQSSTTSQNQPTASTTQTVPTDPIHRGILDLYKNQYKGEGTYYGPGEGGTCSYLPPRLPPYANISTGIRLIALNKPQFFGSLACGMCFKIHGDGKGLGNTPIIGESIGFVKDLCPECQPGDVDLAEDGDGRWDIEIQAVQCPVGDTKLTYKFQGTNPWYLKIQIRNSRIPVTGLSIWQPKSKQWSKMKPTLDAFWEMGPGHFEKPIYPSVRAPLKMRLTSANGVVIYDEIKRMENGAIIRGTGKQFPVDQSLPQA